MKALEEYYELSTTLYEDIEELIGMTKEERDKVNVLVLNIILKYIAAYLSIKNPNVDAIKAKVHEIVENSDKERQFDDKQSLTGSISQMGDSHSLDCLFDLRQTSAVFKEVALCENFDSEEFQSIDLGSGTGILSLATYIAGRRKNFGTGEIISLDHSEKAITRGSEILAPLEGQYSFKARVGDILTTETYNGLNLDKLSFWVSETIALSTAPFSIDPEEGEIFYEDNISEKIADMHKHMDPFQFVLSNFIRMYPGIFEKFKRGKIAMFPNYAKKLYIPNLSLSTIKLQTGVDSNAQKLYHIGSEFNSYEDLGVKRARWHDVSNDVTSKNLEEMLISQQTK